MARGRPVGSNIRQNIVEILYFMEKGYGYEVHKVYQEIFPKASRRVIYYHLKKGLQTEEFVVEKIEKESGSYSWGETAEKTYYALGPNAKPKIEPRVKEYFDNERSDKQIKESSSNS